MKNNIFKTATRCVAATVLLCVGLTCKAQTVPADHTDKIWMCVLDQQTRQSQRLFVIEQLTSASSPTLSPDGSRIAFDGAAPGEASSPGARIFVSNLDGSNLKDLGPGAMPSWSPRGSRLAFSKYSPEQGVWLMNADGQNQRLIDQQGWSIQWSPNGQMLAYTRQIDSGVDFRIFNLVEDEFSTVFHGDSGGYNSFYWNFAWSPDSKRICFKGTGIGSKTHISSIAINSDPVVDVHYVCESAIADFTWLDNATIGTCMRTSEQNLHKLFTIDASATTAATETGPTEIGGQFPGRNNSDGDVSRNGRLIVYVSRPANK